MTLPYADDQVERTISLPADQVVLEGTLGVPEDAHGVVLFAHGSGSSRFSPRNRYAARVFRQSGLATLLLDLLSAREEERDQLTGEHRFDIPLLARRLVAAIDWLGTQSTTRDHGVGLFGASTGGGAALVAAALRPERVKAVVSRGGRPDLAEDSLPKVQAPTLLIVGALDVPVIRLNEQALDRMEAHARLVIVPGASHLFEEPGALDEVGELSRDWFVEKLGVPAPAGGKRR
jgi:putative phosphoribosyl transferase